MGWGESASCARRCKGMAVHCKERNDGIGLIDLRTRLQFALFVYGNRGNIRVISWEAIADQSYFPCGVPLRRIAASLDITIQDLIIFN